MKITEIAQQTSQGSPYFQYLSGLNPKTHQYIKARSAELLQKRFQNLTWQEAIKHAAHWLLQLGKDHIDHSTYAAMQRGELEPDLPEAKASDKLCKSNIPDKRLGASNLASCKSQGYRARDGEKSHKIGSKRVKMGGKKIKGKKYGGPIPDYS